MLQQSQSETGLLWRPYKQLIAPQQHSRTVWYTERLWQWSQATSIRLKRNSAGTRCKGCSVTGSRVGECKPSHLGFKSVLLYHQRPQRSAANTCLAYPNGFLSAARFVARRLHLGRQRCCPRLYASLLTSLARLAGCHQTRSAIRAGIRLSACQHPSLASVAACHTHEHHLVCSRAATLK